MDTTSANADGTISCYRSLTFLQVSSHLITTLPPDQGLINFGWVVHCAINSHLKSSAAIRFNLQQHFSH